MVQSPSTALGNARRVLLLVPGMAEGSDAACAALSGGDGEAANVLGVSFSRSAADWLANHAEHAGTPANAKLVETGGTTHPDAVSVDSPGDLTGVEIALGEPLEAFAEAGGPVTVCVDSLTVLLQYVDLDRAYRFVHQISRRFQGVDALVHYHVDPGACDEATLATLATLMDAAVGVDTDPPGGTDERVPLGGAQLRVSRRHELPAD